MRKKHFLLFIAPALLLEACQDLGIGGCTKENRSYSILYKDKTGKPRAVKNFEVYHKRTNERLTIISNYPYQTGYYLVIDDSAKQKLNRSGDEIIISALDTVNNQTASVIFRVKGGISTCHIEKISGPDELRIE